MPPDGKYAEGLKGFPTPNLVPADGGYIVFKIPRDNEWAGLILGAAQLLAQSYNWYQWGDMTPDEAAEAFRVIVNQAPYDTCGCNQPTGSRVLRVNNTGHIQQLTDGEWTEPTDDYTIPPTPAREEPTCDERRCAAAANAANVLQQLYEEVADAVADGADEAEALAVLIGAAIIIIGGWLGLALAALVGLATGYFFAFLEIAEFMTADLWTSDFTEKLKCFLYECSSCDGDVVTFDFQCVRQKMAEYTDILDPQVITNIRLFGQVDFILNVIGVDGLNAAGATTAITVFDCSECEHEWCYAINFEDFSGGMTVEFGGTWVAGVGWKPTDVTSGNSYRDIELQLDLGALYEVTAIGQGFDFTQGACPGGGFNAWGIWAGQANPFDGSSHVIPCSATTDSPPEISFNLEPGAPTRYMYFEIVSSTTTGGGFSGDATLKNITIHGTGDAPTHLEADGWYPC